jgi:hypothetical protein
MEKPSHILEGIKCAILHILIILGLMVMTILISVAGLGSQETAKRK